MWYNVTWLHLGCTLGDIGFMSTLFDEIADKNNDLINKSHEITQEYENHQTTIAKRAEHFIISIAVILVIFSIVFGIVIGCTLYKHEVQGLHTECYTTNTGKCYHSASCGYLHSRNKTNVYSAIKRGYTSCSRCSVGTLDVSDKNEIGYGLLTAFGFSIIVFAWIFIKKNKTDEKRNNSLKKEKDQKIESIEFEFKSYLLNMVRENGILRIIDAPEHIQLMNGKLYSSKENLYRYIGQQGKCYHLNRNCVKGVASEVLIYDLIGKYYPCGKCQQYYPDQKPEWYKRYESLCLMLKM